MKKVLKLVFCSKCGNSYKVCGDYKKLKSMCCGVSLTSNIHAVFSFFNRKRNK